ncbi:MAG: PEP/pyruvate-binding domain-containing protein [Flavobacteriaceae bacterium]|nr:PEP/pyruvate-binding domain-containing protein [Flavobacteriaceae bacterium]
MYTKKLNNCKDLTDMGNKCRNLALLTEYGFNVPKAYGITFAAFGQFIKPLVSKVESIIQTNDYKTASEKIRELISNSPVPADVRTDIEKVVIDFSPDTKFAVRSSGMVLKNGEAIVEDSAKKSLAGQYESFLNVPPTEVVNAVKLCWASLFNERSLHVFEAKNNNSFLGSKMSVVIQQMVIADVSAVMMTQDPLEKVPLLAMETTFGACEAIVSGKVTGDLITIDRNSMVVYNREIGSKRNRVVYDIFSGNNRGSYNLSPTSDEMQKNFSVDNKTALRIAKVGLEIEKKFGHPQDIELVVADQEIFIVQTRNITTNIH